MRERVLLAAMLALGLVLTGCGGEDRSPESEARTIGLVNGEVLTLDDMAGRWLFVNYWAEWCAPCLVEIPELNEFHEDAADRVIVLGVNFDRLPAEEMLPQVESLDIRFPVAVSEPSDVLDIASPQVLPSTYVFNPAGERVGVLVGPQSLEQLYAVLETESAELD